MKSKITNADRFIESLKSANLVAQCPYCDKEFRLADAPIFNGLGKMPKQAEEIKNNLFLELKKRLDELKRRKVYADVGAEKKAIEVGFGKIIEKFIPAYKDLKLPLRDCRPLFEPIDIIVFNGLIDMKVNSITFLEIKSGGSSLNKHQRMIRDAVLDKRVDFEVV